MKKKLFFSLILLFIILLTIEIFSWISCAFLVNKGILYTPESVSFQEYQDYLQTRDGVLGWPSLTSLAGGRPGPYDQSGSRIIPAFPDPGAHSPCLSLYGDSFTFGGANPQTAWANILSKLLDCRVANYGVGGYGTDQAYLRFIKNHFDRAPVVILGYSTENILRNVNQYRFLLYRGRHERLALKPRFIVQGDKKLKLIPILKLEYDDFKKMTENPQEMLKYEYFLPGKTSGIFRNNFPFTVSLIKALFNNFHIKSKLKGRPWYEEFYQPDHPSEAIEVTFKIFQEFYSEAKRINKRPLLFVIPTGLDLKTFRRTEYWPYQNLLIKLEKAKFEYLDAGPAIIEYLKQRDPCELFSHCSSHYNQEGERVLALIIYRYLKENEFFE